MRSSSSVVAEDAPNLSLDVVDRCDFILAANSNNKVLRCMVWSYKMVYNMTNLNDHRKYSYRTN